MAEPTTAATATTAEVPSSPKLSTVDRNVKGNLAFP